MEETLRNLTTLNSAQRKKTILELMELTRMDQHLLEVPVKQLSGGEQRRLSLLRALSIKPDFLVLDEVTSGLDVVSADAVLTLLENYHTHYGCSYLLITHDRQAAYRISDHKEGHQAPRKGQAAARYQVEQFHRDQNPVFAGVLRRHSQLQDLF